MVVESSFLTQEKNEPFVLVSFETRVMNSDVFMGPAGKLDMQRSPVMETVASATAELPSLTLRKKKKAVPKSNV